MNKTTQQGGNESQVGGEFAARMQKLGQQIDTLYETADAVDLECFEGVSTSLSQGVRSMGEGIEWSEIRDAEADAWGEQLQEVVNQIEDLADTLDGVPPRSGRE